MPHLKGPLTLAVALGALALSHAQSRASFRLVDNLNGLSTSQVGLAWTVSLTTGASLRYEGTTYQITDVFGFWILDDHDDLTATGTAQNGWDWDSNTSGSGAIFGWQNSSKQSTIFPGQSKTFTYSSVSGTFETVGYHVRLSQPIVGTSGNTLFVTENLATPPVPEPFTLALAAAGLGLAAKRRLRK